MSDLIPVGKKIQLGREQYGSASKNMKNSNEQRDIMQKIMINDKLK